MQEYNDCSISPIDRLKQEIELRHNILKYKKLHKNFLLNRIEKNNVNLLFEAIEDLKSETIR